MIINNIIQISGNVVKTTLNVVNHETENVKARYFDFLLRTDDQIVKTYTEIAEVFCFFLLQVLINFDYQLFLFVSHYL